MRSKIGAWISVEDRLLSISPVLGVRQESLLKRTSAKLSSAWNDFSSITKLTKAQRNQLKKLASIYKHKIKKRERYFKRLVTLDKQLDKLADRMVFLEVGDVPLAAHPRPEGSRARKTH